MEDKYKKISRLEGELGKLKNEVGEMGESKKKAAEVRIPTYIYDDDRNEIWLGDENTDYGYGLTTFNRNSDDVNDIRDIVRGNIDSLICTLEEARDFVD